LAISARWIKDWIAEEMIKFKCGKCNHKIGAPDKYAGQLVRCPNCKAPMHVPGAVTRPDAQSANVIKLRCPHCNQMMGATPDHVGRQVRCPRCKNPFRIPDVPAQPRPPAARDGLAVLRAGHEQRPDSQSIEPDPTGIDELLRAGADQPGLELQPPIEPEPPLELQPPAFDLPSPAPSDYDPSGDESFGYAGGGALHWSSRSVVPPSGAKKKRSGIIIGAVCGFAALLMVILGWRFLTGLRDVVGQTGKNVQEAQRFTEEYIFLLQAGEIDKAIELLSPGLRSYVQKSDLESFAGLIGKSRIVDLHCRLTHIEEQPDGYEYLLSYSLRYERDQQIVAASVVQADGDLRMNGIAIQGPSGQSFSVGPRNYEEMTETMMVSTLEKLRSFASRYFCGLGILWLLLVVIYIISMWVVFDKAGQPGWASIVPIYNMWVLAEIGGKPGWWGLAACFVGFVPFVGWIMSLILAIMISIGVAETFGRGVVFGLGLCFLGFIFYPILAFSSN